MRRFQLNRKEDKSGVSGTGVVAQGVQFDNGKVALQWLTAMPTLETADNVETIIQIHGHEGATDVEWLDEPSKDVEKALGVGGGYATTLPQNMSGGTAMATEDLDKAGTAGEGSRGGHIIGHTKTGKPIYSSSGHPAHGGFTPMEHKDAKEAHYKRFGRILGSGGKRSPLYWRTNNPKLRDALGKLAEHHLAHGKAHDNAMISGLFKKAEEGISKSLDRLASDMYLSIEASFEPDTEFGKLADLLSKSKDYISIDADNAGNKISQAEQKNDEKAARKISNRINAGLTLFKNWVKHHNGYIIELGGDEGLAKVGNLSLRELKKFVEEYKDLTGFTLTIGIGKRMSQATNARMLGKLKGKNRIEVWKDEKSQKELKEYSKDLPKNETEKLKEAGLLK